MPLRSPGFRYRWQGEGPAAMSCLCSILEKTFADYAVGIYMKSKNHPKQK